MQGCLYNTEHRIISWKPPIQPVYKINMDVFQSDDRIFAIGAAVIRDADFRWFSGITRRLISPCLLATILITLREALKQAWSYQLNMLEVDLRREVIEELQAGPQTCRSYLQQVATEVSELLNRNWQDTLNYAQRLVNLSAAVLACLCKEQRVVVIHADPPESLLPALELDHDTFAYAQQIENDEHRSSNNA